MYQLLKKIISFDYSYYIIFYFLSFRFAIFVVGALKNICTDFFHLLMGSSSKQKKVTNVKKKEILYKVKTIENDKLTNKLIIDVKKCNNKQNNNDKNNGDNNNNKDNKTNNSLKITLPPKQDNSFLPTPQYKFQPIRPVEYLGQSLEKKYELTTKEHVYVQELIEECVKKDKLSSIITIIDRIGMYYLDNNMCVIAAKNKAFNCINWFFKNNVFVDKFALEEAIKVNDLEMTKLIIPNLNSRIDIWIYIYAVTNESIKCLEYIMDNHYHNDKKIFEYGIIHDKKNSISTLLKYGFNFNENDIYLACKHGSINILCLLKKLKIVFTEEMAYIAKNSNQYLSYQFINRAISLRKSKSL